LSGGKGAGGDKFEVEASATILQQFPFVPRHPIKPLNPAIFDPSIQPPVGTKNFCNFTAMD
jgi:hypothetical protein